MPEIETHADSVRVYLTGASSNGGAQSDPNAALGNYRSSTRFESLGISKAGGPANVTVNFASGVNGTGDGEVSAESVDTLAWKPPGGTKGAAVTITNGQTKILEGGDGEPEKFVEVTRTSADDLSGTATVTLADVFNNLVGFDNVSSAEASAGDDEYRGLCFYNESASQIKDLTVWVGQIGTARVSSVGNLGGSGSGTIESAANAFDDWPDSGYCRVETSGDAEREIVYYSSRTGTVLTVPAAGRGLLGTSATEGANDDNVYSVPGIRIAKEAPNAQATGYAQTIANESTEPEGRSWDSGITEATGVVIGDLTAEYIYFLWIHREIPVGAVAEASVLNLLEWSFDAA